MNFFSVLIALLLERYRSASLQNRVYSAFDRYADWLDEMLNSGERHHGVAAWALAVAPVLAVAGAAFFFSGAAASGLEWLVDFVVLVLLIDFRATVKRLTALQLDLRHEEREEVARRLGFPPLAPPELSNMVARGIEQAVLGVHGHLLALLFWYCVLPGPLGPLLYLMAMRLDGKWGRDDKTDFGHFSRRAFCMLDWLPLRLTALTFAIVGNFEDSLFCWRTQAPEGGSSPRMILASAAGALGIRLGDSSSPNRFYVGLELGVGEAPDTDHLRSAEGMIWRAVVLWVLLIGLLTIAARVG
jgi:adenosylcobinamide-phosphate synthase